MSTSGSERSTVERLDHPARLILIAFACLVLATDPTSIPGHIRWWSFLYIIPAFAVLWWGKTKDYRALLVFGASFYGLTLLRIVQFAAVEGWGRRAGVALNVLVMVFAQGFVSHRRAHSKQVRDGC